MSVCVYITPLGNIKLDMPNKHTADTDIQVCTVPPDLLSSACALLQNAVVVSDVYETLMYSLCIAFRANGGFMSIDGKTKYFDVVVGSYRQDRLGSKGGMKMWDYNVPKRGKSTYSDPVWLYRSSTTGWLIGLKQPAYPPEREFVEQLSMSASIAAAHIRRKKTVDGRDNLTGLFDRGAFFRDLRHLTDVADKDRLTVCLLFIDLNNFKAVNDTLGHQMGDRVLISQAHEIRRCVQGYGTVYRYGGDEFCVILPGIGKNKTEDMARQIETMSEQAPGGLTVSLSVGVVYYRKGEGIDKFIERADAKMYNKKVRRSRKRG